MQIARKVKNAAGLVLAPWSFLVGRAVGSRGLQRLTLNMDPQYLRAFGATSSRQHSSMHVGQFKMAAMMAARMEPELSERLKRLISVSESQILQDLFCALVLNEKRAGYFVEVGVGSGKSISNTYMLEKELGWTGLLVEPNRTSHATIEACRTAKLDKRAAASVTGKTLRFQEVVGAGEHSRISDTGGHKIAGHDVEEYDVTTISLNDLFALSSSPQEIDYLSLDTEGSEIDILRGIDFGRYTFKVMTIEHNFNMQALSEMDSILTPKGYKRVLTQLSSFDAWYVHESVQNSRFFGILEDQA